MDTTEQLKLHKRLVDDAVRLRPMERVPHLSNFAMWSVLDYGAKPGVACRDWSLMEKVQRAFMDKYRFDCSGSFGAYLSCPPGMLDSIGPGYNVFDDEADSVMLADVDLLHAEDYDEYLSDPFGLAWNRLLPRKFERWGDRTVGDFQKAIDEFIRFNNYLGHMSEVAISEYGLPSLGQPGDMLGIEVLFNTRRGIKGLSHDMRRIPDKLQQVIGQMDAGIDALGRLSAYDAEASTSAFGTVVYSLAHSILSLDQWDKYYWPSLSRIIDAVVETDTTMLIFAESFISRFYDYFRDVPAGHLAIQIEQDDVFDFKAQLPNVCVVGGMSTRLLGNGSVKQCVDYAKFLCDELGREGGFILSQDKMMSHLVDAKPENIQAVCDYVVDYAL
ncbi:MAG: hypothetical protein FWH50_01245 [Coriobacteriia bacterium]|nr:hypothetical protein [Coriobacteriia bacterium]